MVLFGTAMNSLSILSSRVDKVIGSTPSTPTSDAFKELRPHQLTGPETITGQETSTCPSSAVVVSASVGELRGSEDDVTTSAEGLGSVPDKMPSKLSALEDVYSRAAQAWMNAYRWAVDMTTFCAGWIAKWFYDENDKFFVYLPAYTILITLSTVLIPQLDKISSSSTGSTQGKLRISAKVKNFMRVPSSDEGPAVSSSTAFSPHSHHARARSISHGDSAGEETAPRRSIRIRLFNEYSSKSPKSSSVKSPTSPSNSSTLRLTKYPRSTGPPRPLLAKNPPQKTLILDLDETLIHSLSKGGRLTSGHMVEVKLEGQHPILYYVHKRPYCEEFLRKVCFDSSIGQTKMLGFNQEIFCAGIQMVQSGNFYSLGAGVRRPSH